MNIPRHFYGVNYLSKLVANYQDSDKTTFSKTEYTYIDNKEHIALDNISSFKLGLNAGITNSFIEKIFSDISCGIEGIAIARGEDVLAGFYRPPYSKKTPHITNSTCKTVTAIGVMFALAEERLRLDDKVLSFFPEHDVKTIPKRVRDITVEHLLTMTSCSKTNELISVTEDDWVKAFLLTDCFEEPGTKFIYNSINTYMLGAIVHKVTGEGLMTYLTPRLFAPLGITGIKWELCPKGLECAGWGLHISLEGMLKLGMFLSSDGSFRGKQLIQPSFIRMMKKADVYQDTDRLSSGYGYQLWHLPDGMYMLSGMYGQHVIINEDKKLIVAVNAHSNKMFPDSRLTKAVIAFMTNDNLYKPDNYFVEMINYRRLKNTILKLSSDTVPKNEENLIRKYITRLYNKRLCIENGSVKLFPYLMQSMYKYPPYNINELKISDGDDCLKISFFKSKASKDNSNREYIEFNFGVGIYYHEMKSFGEDVRPVACKAYMAKDEDGRNVLMLSIVFPDAGYSRIFKLFFMDEGKVFLESIEYPDVKAIVDQVISGETVLAGTPVDLADKLPEGLRVMLDQQMEPRMNVKILIDR